MLDTIAEEPAPVPSLRSAPKDLRDFLPAGKGSWEEVPDPEWNDWKWQLRHRITALEQIEARMPRLRPEERSGILFARRKLSLAITPFFFNLIDGEDTGCPIRRQVIPLADEARQDGQEMIDPCAEDGSSPVPGIVHRYPDRILFLVTDRCAAYCRYCTRSRMVSNATGYDFHPQLERQIAYVEGNPRIRDVLLSGGDPLLLGDDKLDTLLGRLHRIPHVEFLRIGTRIPLFLPQRITPGLCEVLRRYPPLFVSIHCNHPAELTLEVRQGLDRLAEAGIPLGNQSVLLRGVNDSVGIMKALVHKLLRCRVRPYYLYQCDLIRGSAHLRTPVSKGIEIIRGLRGHTTGYAVPQFVIDAPGGGGKVPVNPDWVVRHDEDSIVVRNYQGRAFEYPERP